MSTKKEALGTNLPWIGGGKKKKENSTKEKQRTKAEPLAAFNVKMPRSLHQALKIEVINKDLTLNEYILSILAKRNK